MGHQVNNTALCPSSLWYDMAMTVADYMYKPIRPSSQNIGYDVAHMEVAKPLIIKPEPGVNGQLVQVEATVDLEEGSSAQVKFRSVNPDGTLITEHAACIVNYENVSVWQDSWESISFLVKAQIDNLQKKTKTQEAHVIGRGLAYKLFKVFVDYSETYRGMEEIILDNKSPEATASIHIQT